MLNIEKIRTLAALAMLLLAPVPATASGAPNTGHRLGPPRIDKVPQPAPGDVDTDGDGLSDLAEKNLLARFRPYYKFSTDGGEDRYHPADALWFARHSKLLRKGQEILSQSQIAADPLSILSVGPSPDWERTDILRYPDEVGLKLSKPTSFKLDIKRAQHTGESDRQKIRDSAVGLYGHVVRLFENPAQRLLTTGYKIEYWQFFAFNDAIIDDYRHEGDWETVQVVLDPTLEIRRVIHEVHGRQIRFDIKKGRPVMHDGFVEYEGTGPARPQRGPISLYVDGPAGIGWAQNNLLQLHCEGDECTHPIVYVEHSGHAFWPTSHWGWPGARKHNGKGEQYLTATPCNLGEVEDPDPDCGQAGNLVLRFTGRWGNYNEGPEGPAQKASWGTP